MVVGLNFLNNTAMKMIGFREKYDKKLIASKYFYASTDKNMIAIANTDLEKLIQYLEKSDRIFGMTRALDDGETYIAPYAIYSDGDWLWPSYCAYFLKKEGIINKDFFDHVSGKGFETKRLSQEQRKKVTILLERALLGIE
jgi:hypothetical protein